MTNTLRVPIAGAALVLVLLAGCGDDAGEPATTTAPTTVLDDRADDDTAPADDDIDDAGGGTDGGTGGDASAALIGEGACSLLDESFLADTVSFEFGDSVWEERPDASDADRCRWFNESKLLTVTVTAMTIAEADLDGRRAEPPSTGSIEDVDITAGSFAVRDDFGERIYQLWIPLEGNVVVSVVADVMQIDDDQFLAVGREVAARAAG